MRYFTLTMKTVITFQISEPVVDRVGPTVGPTTIPKGWFRWVIDPNAPRQTILREHLIADAVGKLGWRPGPDEWTWRLHALISLKLIGAAVVVDGDLAFVELGDVTHDLASAIKEAETAL